MPAQHTNPSCPAAPESARLTSPINPTPVIASYDFGVGDKSCLYWEGQFKTNLSLKKSSRSQLLRFLIDHRVTVLLTEASSGSYNPVGWNRFLDGCAAHGILVYVMNPKQTKNMRLDIGLKKPKEDQTGWDIVDAYMIRLAGCLRPQWFYPARHRLLRTETESDRLENVRRDEGYRKTNPELKHLLELIPTEVPNTMRSSDGRGIDLAYVLPLVADMEEFKGGWESYRNARGFFMRGEGCRIRESLYRSRLRTLLKRRGLDRRELRNRRAMLYELQRDLHTLFNYIHAPAPIADLINPELTPALKAYPSYPVSNLERV